MRERHGTPFEHNFFRFHIKAPLFVTREWQRHRVGSFNERSGRYSELPDEFYVPAAERRAHAGRQARRVHASSRSPTTRPRRCASGIEASYAESYRRYQELLDAGVAKEVARSVLPVGLYTEFYWSVNARSLMNFLSLRNAATAQREIRALRGGRRAALRRARCPSRTRSFVEQGRTAP